MAVFVSSILPVCFVQLQASCLSSLLAHGLHSPCIGAAMIMRPCRWIHHCQYCFSSDIAMTCAYHSFYITCCSSMLTADNALASFRLRSRTWRSTMRQDLICWTPTGRSKPWRTCRRSVLHIPQATTQTCRNALAPEPIAANM